MATITDVARRAGVSPTTAKRAIRTPELLAPDTLLKVQRAVAELGYEPDQVAATLRRGQSHTVGLIVGSIVEPFFAGLTRAVGKSLRAEGYTLLVADNEYDVYNELEQLRAFAGLRIAGLVLRSGYGTPNLEYLRRMQVRGTAVVEVDYLAPESPFSHVMLDNEGCVRTGLRYLASLGHTRIASLGTFHPTILPDERTLAFAEVMNELGLPVPADYQRVIYPTPREAYTLTKALMRLPEPPTALFSTTGNLALGAFRALQELQLRIPHDVSLLTFDDYPWTQVVDPAIDVIEQPVEAMGIAAAQRVVQEIRNPGLSPQQLRLSGTLIRRGSCGPPP